jgi:hypothetical protein
MVEEEVRLPGGDGGAPDAPARGRESASEAPRRGPDARRSHCEKSVRPVRRRELAAWFQSAVGASCVWACRLAQFRPGGLVSPESGARSVGAAPADSRLGPRPAPLRVSADLGAAAPRGLADQSQACAPALSVGGRRCACASGAASTWPCTVARRPCRLGPASAGDALLISGVAQSDALRTPALPVPLCCMVGGETISDLTFGATTVPLAVDILQTAHRVGPYWG